MAGELMLEMLKKHVRGDDERRMLCEHPRGMQVLAIFNYCYLTSRGKRLA